MRVSILFLFLTVGALAKEPIKQTVILSQLEDGSLKLRSEIVDLRLGELSDEELVKVSSKQKLVNPKFHVSFLKMRYAIDDTYRYIFLYDYHMDKCQYSVQKRTSHQKILQCYNSMRECMAKEEVITNEKMAVCHNSSQMCLNMGAPLVPMEIDIKYCEKAYGRKLR